MTLARAFSDLGAALTSLCESMAGLHTTVAEDKPLQGDVVLVDRLADAADDVRAFLEQALAVAAEARQPAGETPGAQRAGRALVACQASFLSAAAQFSSDLFGYERLMALDRVARERGGEWRAWAGVVASSLSRCQYQLNEVSRALAYCWEELLEQVAATSGSQKTPANREIMEGVGQDG